MTSLRMSLLFVLFAATVAVSSASATCTNASVVGVFGSLVAGFDAVGQPGASLSQYNFDGLGNVSGTIKHNNGTLTNVTFTGTYSVAKNCTGSMVLNKSNGGTENDNFVLDNGKKGMQIIRADSPFIEPGFAAAEGVVTCGLSGVKQVFALNSAGVDLNKGHTAAFVGQLILDGHGNVSGTATVSIDGTIAAFPISGTYTENSDCTGTAQVTIVNTSNSDFVVVNGGKELLLLGTDSGQIFSGNAQR